MKPDIRLTEVGPRDGLQNEIKLCSVDTRVELIRKLAESGLNSLEGGALVSPKAIPQMVGSESVWQALQHEMPDLAFLVPNEKGLERAELVGIQSISVFTATSELFNKKNIGMSVKESLDAIERLMKRALERGMKVRAYVSTAFGCPYEGPQNPKILRTITETLLNFGAYEISIGDTIGVAHPAQVRKIVSELGSLGNLDRLALHMHDTRGSAVANIVAGLEAGIRSFDSSIGGLGGCPYAQGASGNVATEEVVWLLEGLGLKTGISIESLLKTVAWVEQMVERPLKGKLYLSKPQRLYYDWEQ